VSILLFRKTSVDEQPKTRNRSGVCNIFRKALDRGERVTLEQAIAILRRDW